MNARVAARVFTLSGLIAFGVPVGAAEQTAKPAASAAQQTVRVTGVVRDESNNITLPGIPVEVVGGETVYTDVDGRYLLNLAPGSYDIKVLMEGYQERIVKIEVPAGSRTPIDANVGLTMARFAETVVVTAEAPLDAVTSTAEAQLIERKNANVISDNMGAQEMRKNGDSDAAVAMSRVTGLSVVDNQFVFVRGLGERYSSTTLAGAVLPTTEPDKKVVPLDLFPAGLLDSIQVNKSYSPDRSAEFAGGLVQIMPVKFPTRPVVTLGYEYNFFSTATGKEIPLSPFSGNDRFGFDGGERALPGGIPNSKIVRRGIYTPEVGYGPDEITAFGRQMQDSWTPQLADGAPGQNWNAVFGNRFNKLGVVASVTHSYKEQFVDEQRAFYRVADEGELEAVSNYQIEYGTQKAQLGAVGNIAYQFTGNHRLSFENFYSHSGRDEGRFFEGPNTENNFYYVNQRLQYIEEDLLANAVGGEHFFRGWSNSRIDWRLNYAKANRDEPGLRETLYQIPFIAGTLNPQPIPAVLSDESQSGFMMDSTLDDETVDGSANWSIFSTAGDRPTQYKFGFNYVERAREFQSRRFRYIPVVLNKTDPPAIQFNPTLPPEELFTQNNIGTAFRFNEETRPVDAYDGDQSTTAGYGMVDISLTAKGRLVAGARVERFEQVVNTFDPFGLFVSTVTTENTNTDVFPSLNFVHAVRANTNLRLSYSGTVNRPEFRELAPFEFTDVVGSRAVRGNPDLERARIQNVDGRWELFPGGRSIAAASVFFKHFDQPIERVVIAGAQPIVTFQNADTARNFGIELEAAHNLFEGMFVSANYTFVDSKITLLPEQRTVQTSLERPLAGQSKNLFNLMGEYTLGGFFTRLLVNYFGDRISDVGSNQAPDIVEEGRTSIDLVFGHRINRFNLRLTVENLTDAEFRFTQGADDQRLYKLGRTLGFGVGFNVF